MKPSRTVQAILAAALTAALAPLALAAPIRVLILSGQEVHDVKTTTPFLESMYKADAKRFEVIGIIEDVSTITDETFARCDVIVSNWTCHPVMTGGPWTPEGKEAFAKAVRGGKGMVSFHAACAACNDWAEFQEICGLTWKLDHTGHTAYHTFKVVMSAAKHPITSGLSDFWITDELYQRMVKLTEADFTTLSSAFAHHDFGGTSAWEPMLIVTKLGKGRGVNLLLGHDVQTMRNTAWQTLMLRSTEWAATGRATVPKPANWPTTPAAAAIAALEPDEVIAAAAAYTHGQSRQALFAVEQLVNHANSLTDKSAAQERAALADKLAQAIATCQAPEAKAFFCRQLGNIATPEQATLIAPLLADPQVSTMARLALERIDAPQAAAALRDALSTLTGEMRIGVIDSVGIRADAGAVEVLATLLGNADQATASAAASALGRIGTAQASQVLRTARSGRPTAPESALIDAMLTCAEGLLVAGDKTNAAAIYKLLYAPAEMPAVRAAALRGLLIAQPTQANMLIGEAFESARPELVVAIAQVTRQWPRIGDTRIIAAAAMRTPPELQVIMIAALRDRGDKAALDSLRRGMEHDSAEVRLATINALVRLGNETDAAWLAERALTGPESDRSDCVEALGRMPGPEAESALVDLLLSGRPEIVEPAADALVNRPADDKVLELVDKLQDEPAKTALLGRLDQIGNEAALAALRKAATSDNQQVRQTAHNALARWPTPAEDKSDHPSP